MEPEALSTEDLMSLRALMKTVGISESQAVRPHRSGSMLRLMGLPALLKTVGISENGPGQAVRSDPERRSGSMLHLMGLPAFL